MDGRHAEEPRDQEVDDLSGRVVIALRAAGYSERGLLTAVVQIMDLFDEYGPKTTARFLNDCRRVARTRD